MDRPTWHEFGWNDYCRYCGRTTDEIVETDDVAVCMARVESNNRVIGLAVMVPIGPIV